MLYGRIFSKEGVTGSVYLHGRRELLYTTKIKDSPLQKIKGIRIYPSSAQHYQCVEPKAGDWSLEMQGERKDAVRDIKNVLNSPLNSAAEAICDRTNIAFRQERKSFTRSSIHMSTLCKFNNLRCTSLVSLHDMSRPTSPQMAVGE